MDIPTALAQMRGKTIGALLREDGSARLQWPEPDGSLPDEMERYQVADARIQGDIVEMDLISPEASFTFYFEMGVVMP